MPFADLYHHCQTLTPKISRNVIRDKVLDLTGFNRIKTMKTSLDTSVCRGFYLSARNQDHKFVQQHGSRIIVLAREGLNHCWERFVYVKELMHAFDDPAKATDTGDAFERMLSDLTPGAPAELSPQGLSEIKCFWMALAVLCPDAMRREFEAERKAQRIDDYAIAIRLRIPQGYVPRLFEKRYQPILTEILAANPSLGEPPRPS